MEQKDSRMRLFIISAIVSVLATTAGYMIAPIEVRYISIALGRLSDRSGRRKFILYGCNFRHCRPLRNTVPEPAGSECSV